MAARRRGAAGAAGLSLRRRLRPIGERRDLVAGFGAGSSRHELQPRPRYGTLRLSLDSDPDPDHALVAHLGLDGIYRDVDTNVPIARPVDSKAVLIDLDLAPLPSGGGAAGSDSDRDEPKLCPDPSKDQGGGRKLFDVLYEQFVRNHVNPQRNPQLPPGIAFALPADTKSGWVHYDDCREATGGMIEAKGNYSEMLDAPFKRDWLRRDWLDQAARQIKGAHGRAVDWYFHDQKAADFAREIFTDAKMDSRIGIQVLPYPGGVPNYNPRVR